PEDGFCKPGRTPGKYGPYNPTMATLVVLQGPQPGQQFTLDQGHAVIGRVTEVAICLPTQSVSRRHAQITFRHCAYFLGDLGSVNGPFLNGQRLAAEQPLGNSDQIKVGDWVLKFQADPEPRGTTSTVVEKVKADISNKTLYLDQPERKLEIMLGLA